MHFLTNNINQIFEVILVTIIVVAIFKLINIFNKNFTDKILAKHEDATILSFLPLLDKVLKIVVLFIAIATILQSHGYSITSLIAGFGITGLAVGLGAQTTISNFFGSFALMSDKAYRIGDYIVINQTLQEKSVEGMVEDINLRSTKLRTASGDLIIVPNSLVANGVVKNINQSKAEVLNEN